MMIWRQLITRPRSPRADYRRGQCHGAQQIKSNSDVLLRYIMIISQNHTPFSRATAMIEAVPAYWQEREIHMHKEQK